MDIFLRPVSISLHIAINFAGLLLNSVLLYLVLKHSPKNIKTYSILLLNFAATDFLACASGIFVAQRIIPCGTVLAFTSGGLCKFFNRETCFVGHCFNLMFYSHTLWSTLLSFTYRHYVLFHTYIPRSKDLIVIVFLILLPSLFQSSTCSWYALAVDPSPSRLASTIHERMPDYSFVDEILYGITNIFDWRIMVPILHMCLPITPVYIIIIYLRKSIIQHLSATNLSEKSRRLHHQLLGALTAQASLPALYFVAVLTYAPGQLGIFNHPLLEYLTFVCFAFVPMLSPLINFYFIDPYRRTLLRVVCRKQIQPKRTEIWNATSHFEPIFQ